MRNEGARCLTKSGIKLEVFHEARSPDDQEIAAKRQKISEEVKQNIAKTQEKQKAYYDRKHGAGASCEVERLQQKKGKRWLPGFQVEGSLHNCGLPWQGTVSPQGSEWGKGMHLVLM